MGTLRKQLTTTNLIETRQHRFCHHGFSFMKNSRTKSICCIFYTSYILHTLYIHDLLHWYTPVRTLHSANKNLLAVPSSRTILANTAFSRSTHCLECSPLICYLCKYLSFIQKSSQKPFISAGPRHIIRKSAPLNLVLVPRIMALYKFTYLLTYLTH